MIGSFDDIEIDGPTRAESSSTEASENYYRYEAWQDQEAERLRYEGQG